MSTTRGTAAVLNATGALCCLWGQGMLLPLFFQLPVAPGVLGLWPHPCHLLSSQGVLSTSVCGSNPRLFSKDPCHTT